MYEHIKIDAMRYFGMTDMNEIDRMTLGEYFMRMEAAMLRNNDQEKLIHLQAWASQMVQATEGSKKHPKPKYKTFKEFYNADQIEENIVDQYEGITTPERDAKRKRFEVGREIDQKLAERRKTTSNNIQFKLF